MLSFKKGALVFFGEPKVWPYIVFSSLLKSIFLVLIFGENVNLLGSSFFKYEGILSTISLLLYYGLLASVPPFVE